MSWQVEPWGKPQVNAAEIFDLFKKHRLIQQNIDLSVAEIQAAASEGIVLTVKNDEQQVVATVILSGVIDGERGSVCFVPVPKYFGPDEKYQESLREALEPVFSRLIELRGLRRLTAMVPKTRSRTRYALEACGFRKEGEMGDAIQFIRRPPEALVIMGRKAKKENGNGIPGRAG